MKVFFREAEIDDLEILEFIERQCFRDPWNADMLSSELSMSHSVYLVLTDGENIFGYLSYLHILDELHIMNVAVLPDYQGNGYGRLMVKRIIDDAQAKEAVAITLEVRESNYRAQKLYEGFGFALAGTRPHYYMDKENALIYWLELGGDIQ
ncbi:MAG: ribosomal-protein-alanine N-acetyltransferase [Clostridia bacterium]|nr:ribosomal-protein-alanine N-acetyltransferase [Clostridia bacterium]